MFTSRNVEQDQSSIFMLRAQAWKPLAE